MNPYKANLTAAQRAAVDAGRAELMRRLVQPPYSNGQVQGEFAVDFVKEWVDETGTWDQFILERAHGRLDDSWYCLCGGRADVTSEGKDAYTLYLPHAHYFDTVRRQRYGLPCAPDAPCACRLLGHMAVAGALLYGSYLAMNG